MTNRVYTPEEIESLIRQAESERTSDAMADNQVHLIEIIEQLRRELSQAREVRDIANDAAAAYRQELKQTNWALEAERVDADKFRASAKAKREKIAAKKHPVSEHFGKRLCEAFDQSCEHCDLIDEMLAILDEATP